MVSAAPTFHDVAAAVGSRLHGGILVAHNLSFDTRMLANEFKRLGATLSGGQGICTLKATGERLNIACDRFGVALDAHHRALADARATAQLLMRLLDGEPTGSPATLSGLDCPLNPRTLRREATGGTASAPLARIVASTRYPTSDGKVLSYLDALDWALDDLVITQVEAEQLRQLTRELGLNQKEVEEAHQRYLEMLVDSARRDGVITPGEHELMMAVASALGVHNVDIPSITPQAAAPTSIQSGTRVCFTGTAVGPTGAKIGRTELEAAASRAGLQPVKNVTKKTCDLLVAADPASASGKARKARSYGIPVVSIQAFCAEIGL
jgi:DNA polymerase-3 subunit epsilon